MTKEEFLRLDYGNIVSCKRYPGEVYEIRYTVYLVLKTGQTIKTFG